MTFVLMVVELFDKQVVFGIAVRIGIAVRWIKVYDLKMIKEKDSS
jgi:hypothetical protein